MSRPYRVGLQASGRRSAYATLARAVRAALVDADVCGGFRQYVVERRTDGGLHLPVLTLAVQDGLEIERVRWRQLADGRVVAVA